MREAMLLKTPRNAKRMGQNSARLASEHGLPPQMQG